MPTKLKFVLSVAAAPPFVPPWFIGLALLRANPMNQELFLLGCFLSMEPAYGFMVTMRFLLELEAFQQY